MSNPDQMYRTPSFAPVSRTMTADVSDDPSAPVSRTMTAAVSDDPPAPASRTMSSDITCSGPVCLACGSFDPHSEC